MSARILVLGGGVGGTLVANRLARSGRGLDVTVVARDEQHLYQTGLLHVPFGDVTVARLERPARGLLDRRVRLVQAAVRAVDPDGRRVDLEGGDPLAYDFLVVATGCGPSARAIPGFYEAAYHFHCSKRAEHLREALAEFKGGRIVVGATRLPYKCPPSPHEFALLLDERLRRDGRRARTRITFVYPLGRVYPIPTLAEFFDDLLRARDIDVEAPFTVAAIDPQRRVACSAEGRELAFDLAVLVPPHAGAPFLREAGLAGDAGWATADRRTLKVRDRVYALGDAADLPVPKSGAAARAQADTVVRNLLAEAEGGGPAWTYDGRVT